MKFNLDVNFCKIVGGESHFVALGNSGSLYSWGIGEYGQLGRPFSELRTYINGFDFIPTKVFFNEPVLDIYSGGFSTFIKTRSGVFACGKNGFGELGFGDLEPKEYLQKVEFFEGHVVKDIVGGLHHTLVLTDKGLFGMGKNLDGQLGLPNLDHYATPTLVDIGHVDQVAVSVSGHHSYIIDTFGSLFVAGQNQYEQLGFPESTIETFRRVDLKGRKCLKVGGGCQFTLALLSDPTSIVEALQLGAENDVSGSSSESDIDDYEEDSDGKRV